MKSAREYLTAASIVIGAIAPAHAQTAGRPVEANVGFATMHLSELDDRNVGVRGTVDVHVARAVAIDGALTWFPGTWNASRSVLDGQGRLLGFVGLKAAAAQPRVDLSGRVGIGFLSFSTQEGPTSCPSQIVTITLACGLAIGYTAFTSELGGGASIALQPEGRLRLRVDAADLLVRYGSVVARSNGQPASGFFTHNLLLSTGIGWRF